MGHENHAPVTKQIRWVLPGDDVKAIVEAITDSSAAKPYNVYVSAGVYSIGDNSIAIPTYVAIVAQGNVVFDYTGNTAKTAFSMTTGSRIVGVTIQNHQSSSYAAEITGTGNYIIDDITFINCSLGILVNNAAASVTVRGFTVLNFSAAMTTGVKCSAGDVTVYRIFVSVSLAVTNLIWADGATADIHVFTLTSYGSTVVNVLYASNGAEIEAANILVKNATYGVQVLSGAKVFINASKTSACTYGAYVDGSGSELYAFSLNLEGNTTYDLYAGTGTKVMGAGLLNSSKCFRHPDATVESTFIDVFAGDEATEAVSELHVGLPAFPRESCLGEGDSYVNGMLVYTYNGTVYTDVTADAKSASGSTFTFPNLLVNTAIYVGSSVLLASTDYHKFFGLKFQNTVAQVGGTIVAEYYNGTAWTAFAHMTSDASGSYYRHADDLFTVAAGSYHTRFNSAIGVDWTKNDDPAVGTAYHWVRFRITSAPTTAPTFEQFKLHSNRTEVNADGYIEYFGKGRAYEDIPVNWNTFKDAGTALTNQDLWLTTNCKTGLTNNEFTIGDSVGTMVVLPSWVDTSQPLKVQVVLSSSTTGTLQMIAWLNHSVDGDTISIADPSSTTGESSEMVSKSVTAGEQITYDFELDISDIGKESASLKPPVLWLNIEADSVPGNVYGMSFLVKFARWRVGDHL